jgi:hypothetical protein
MTNYRKIYEVAYGKIPKDESGRTYEIHHLDGNHNNNDPSNLVALSIKDHYDIHYKQNDWGACQSIMIRWNKDPKLISELTSKSVSQRVNNGTHNFLGGDIARKTSKKRIESGTHHFLDSENQKRYSKKRVDNGAHHFLGGDLQKTLAKKRIDNGSHHFLGSDYNKKRLENGTHPSQIQRTCPHCGKTGKGGGMTNWHFDNCKKKEDS